MQRFGLFSLLSFLVSALCAQAGGRWLPLANRPPLPVGHFLLLSDGTVMGIANPYAYGSTWLRLTPDKHGSYVNGTWSTNATMNFTRLDFDSLVLTNGKVLVAGGEYGTGKATAEIYDPVSNIWTIVPVPVGLLNPALASPQFGIPQGFYDGGAVMLPNGRALFAPVGPNTAGGTLLFDPGTQTWSAGPVAISTAYPYQDEASWVLLPDGSILTVDGGSTNSERYIPASNTWIRDANVPVSLYDVFGNEEGPALLLPNGKAIFFGGTTKTAIYSPSGNTNQGSWVAGPNFPNNLGMPDSPAAMMVNGKILCAVEQAPTNSSVWYAPVSFYEYDYVSNNFTQVAAPSGSNTFNDVCWPTLMLDLPDGSVLFGHRQTDFYIYQPDGVPLAAGKPTIVSITTNANGSLHLTGKLFNGISQGASYGDDEQMDSNFPLVRFTDSSGIVRYGRTYNWSTAGVMTGTNLVSVDSTVPAGASPGDNVQVIANGFESGYDPIVVNTNDSGPGSLRQLVSIIPSGFTITFASDLSGKTIRLTSGELLLTNNLAIDASALPSGITINGSHSSRLFEIAGGVTVVLNSLILTNGYPGAGNSGGAILNSGTLTLNYCTLAGSSVDTSAVGGAIWNGGPLTMMGCAVTGNAAGFAGAINNYSTCTLQNCTFFGNVASPANGGAIDNVQGVLSLIQCTFSGNSAGGVGGGVDNYLGLLNITNSILAGNPGMDIYNWASSTIVLGGANIVQLLVNSGGTVLGSASIIAADPLLGPLANHGGLTRTLLPQAGSPAIDAGVTSAAAGLSYDQRGPGYPRLVGDAVDIGAAEAAVNPYVFNTADSGYGSLRYAVNYSTNNSIITFAPGLSGQTVLVTNGEMVINQNVTIDGAGLTNNIGLNGNHASRVFNVGAGANVVLNSLVLSNAYPGAGNWGGAIANSGTLALYNCTLVANSVDTGTAAGGAIENQGPLALTGCTLSGNTASFAGAIDNRSSCTLRNCTFFGNVAPNNGGAIDNVFGATLSVLHCTFSGNSAGGSGGGIDNYLSQVNLTNTLVTGNNGLDIYNWSGSTVTAGGSNIVQSLGNAGTLIGSASIIAAEPLLGPLANNGGRTQTMPPGAASPAIDAGVSAAAAGLAIDQRGYPRLSGSQMDIGAVELQIAGQPPVLKAALVSGPGRLQLGFTNLAGGSFTVFASTNVAWPPDAWSNIGTALELPPGSGNFQFTDTSTTNYPQRFYRVRSP